MLPAAKEKGAGPELDGNRRTSTCRWRAATRPSSSTRSSHAASRERRAVLRPLDDSSDARAHPGARVPCCKSRQLRFATTESGITESALLAGPSRAQFTSPRLQRGSRRSTRRPSDGSSRPQRRGCFWARERSGGVALWPSRRRPRSRNTRSFTRPRRGAAETAAKRRISAPLRQPAVAPAKLRGNECS